MSTAPLAIVWRCRLSVPAYAAAGRKIEVPQLPCPNCGQGLRRSGGYSRYVRQTRTYRIWIRRGRCRPCRRTHALLPDFLLQRRLDTVEAIGHSVAQAIVRGQGLRTVAKQHGLAHTTVRDWWRRYRQRAVALLTALSAWSIRLGMAAVWFSAEGGRAALEALSAVWQHAARRWGRQIAGLWRFWSGISGGQALGRHTSPPLAGVNDGDWMGPVP